MERFAIIMAGGVGERLWPLSRRHRPKQLLAIGTRHPLLQETIERLLPILPPERIWVITSKNLYQPTLDTLEGILPAENIFAEPAKRNTAGCIVYATALLQARFPEQELSIGVFPADHYIHPPEKFQETLRIAFTTVEQQPVIATIGIKPWYPATGYGYIEVGDISDRSRAALPVRQFREKPDRKTAESFLRAQRFFWNSGMFFWQCSTILRAFQQYTPAIHLLLEQLTTALRHGNAHAASEIFQQLPDISIDYAIMEKAQNLVVIPATFRWSDIGSFSALADVLDTDAAGNVLHGEQIYRIDTQSTILWNNAPLPVVTLGIKDLVIVALPDVIFICHKEQVQRVREVVHYLRQQGRQDLIE